MNWRRPLKWILISMAILLLLLISAILYVHFTLKSGEWTQAAIPQIQPYLTPLGIKLDRLESARIDLLRSIQIQDAAIQWSDAELGEVQLKVKKLILSYSLASLLSSKIEVNEITVQDLHIKARLKSQQSVPDDAPSEPINLAQLSDLLRSPPFPVTAQNININDFSYDIKIEQEHQWQRIGMHLKRLNSNVVWQENDLHGNFKLEFEQNTDSPWIISQGDDVRTVEIKLDPTIKTDFEWQLAFSNNQWRLNKSNLNHITHFENIQILETIDSKLRQLGLINALNFTIDAQLQSTNSNKPSTGLNSIFPLQISTKVNSAIHNLEFSELRQHDLMLDGQAEHRLDMSIEGIFHPFEKPLPNLTIVLEQEFSIPQFVAQVGSQKVSIQKLLWKLGAQGQTHASNPLKLNLTLNNQADSIVYEQQSANDAPYLKAGLKPVIDIATQGQLDSFSDALLSLNLDFEPKILLNNITVQSGKGKTAEKYSIDQQLLAIKGNYNKGKIAFISEIESTNVRAPQVKNKFSLMNTMNINSDIELSNADIKLNTHLDRIPLLQLDLKAINQNNLFTLNHAIKITAPVKLKKYHKAAAILDQVGSTSVDFKGRIQLEHQNKILQDADFTKFTDWPLESHGSILVVQNDKPKDKNGLLFATPANISYTIKKGKYYDVKLDLNIPEVQTPPLQNPLKLAVHQSAQFAWPVSTVSADTVIDIDDTETMNMSISVSDQPQRLTLKTDLTLNSSAEWKKYLHELQQLELIGNLESHIVLNSTVRHNAASILQFDATKTNKVNAQISVNTSVKQTRFYPSSIVKVNKPLIFNQKFKWSEKELDWNAEFKIDKTQLVDVMSIEKLSGNFAVNALSGLDPKNGTVNVHLDQSQFELLFPAGNEFESPRKPLQLGPLTTPLNLTVSAGMLKNNVNLTNLEFDAGANLLTVKAQGNADLEGKNGNLDTTLSVNMRSGLSDTPSLSGSGSIEIPLNLTLINGEQITLEGQTQFKQFSLLMGPLHVKQMNGGIKIEEELLWKDEHIKFRYFEHANPYQRVDYNSIQPYLNDQQTLKVDHIKLDHLNVGPGNAGIVLKQNMFRLQQLDLDMLDGHVTGKLYLDVLPGAWKIGFFNRISQVDLRLLKKDPAAHKKGKHSPISARTAIEFDLNKRLIEGKIDINEITSAQLNQLLDVIDPNHEDEQLANVRNGLKFAYPKKVLLDMKQGFLNLEVLTSAQREPFKVNGLPLTPLIQLFGGEALESLKLIPLDQ